VVEPSPLQAPPKAPVSISPAAQESVAASAGQVESQPSPSVAPTVIHAAEAAPVAASLEATISAGSENGSIAEPITHGLRRGGLWWIGSIAAVLVVAGVSFYIATRPHALVPGVYQCQVGYRISCKIYSDANGVLRLDERPYMKDYPLFGSLQVNGEEVIFGGEAGTGRCNEEKIETAPVLLAIIAPSYANVAEALKACNLDRDVGHLKYDGGGKWRGKLDYYHYFARFEPLPDGRRRVVGFDKVRRSKEFTIGPNQ